LERLRELEQLEGERSKLAQELQAFADNDPAMVDAKRLFPILVN
jgi:hypothetical protein